MQFQKIFAAVSQTINPKLSPLLLLFAGMVLLQACRPELSEPPSPVQGGTEKRFFNDHASQDPRVIAINQNIYRQEVEEPFVKKFVGWAGFPVWNKAKVLQPMSGAGPNSRSITNGVTELIMIPFVKDSTDYISAVLIAGTSGSDTSFKMIYHWQYADYGFDTKPDSSWDARDVFNLFASLEFAVFARTKFVIADTNLIRPPNGYDKAVLSRTGSSTQDITDGKLTIAVQECVLWDVCIPYLFAREASSRMNENDLCYQEYQLEICTAYYYELPSGSSGTSDGGGGSWNDNPCRNYPANGSNPCGESPPVWTPVPVLEDTEPIDSLLARTSRAINAKAAELISLSQANQHWEYVATIVKKDSLIYTKNARTDRDSTFSTPNLSLANGELLMGTIHTHSTTISTDKSAPSHGDIYDLRRHLVKHYISFVECGDVRYALVIEDVPKAANYLKNKSIEYFYSNLVENAMQQPDAYSNWQKATEKALKLVLGSASTCGIGFYISNNTEKTSYTKANP